MSVSFLKTGAESVALQKKEETAAELRKEQSGKIFRFFMKDGEDAKITFVDGDLNAEGFLIPPRYYEHNVMLNGKFGNCFVCPKETLPSQYKTCCFCDEWGDKPSLVALFTVIDHRSYQKDAASKIYKDTKKLFVAKPLTFEILAKLAVKRNGLAGVTFDVSRKGDNSASVGSLFDFDKKTPVAELQSMFVEEVTDPKTNQKVKQTYFTPADYEKEIIFRAPEELLKMGMGKPTGTTGQVSSPAGSVVSGGQADYSQVL